MGLDFRKLILEALRDSAGEWISGERLCSEFGVSRMTVSKHVRGLREQGYHIDTAPRKGYCFHESPNLLFPEEIRSGLRTEVLGQGYIDYAPVMASTNLRAEELALARYGEGTVVVAENQTHGRGRRGRSWFSGNQTGLCMSVILRPPFAPDWSALLSLTCVVAVAEALINVTEMPIRVCWPNDMYIGRKKIGGVLVEILSDMESITHSIVGVGLNINQMARQFPQDIRETSTSLRIESGIYWERITILKEVLFQLERHYWALDDGRADHILRRWRELDLLIGRPVRLETMEGLLEGIAMDISPDGRLLVQDKEGNVLPVMGGKWHGFDTLMRRNEEVDRM